MPACTKLLTSRTGGRAPQASVARPVVLWHGRANGTLWRGCPKMRPIVAVGRAGVAVVVVAERGQRGEGGGAEVGGRRWPAAVVGGEAGASV